MDFTIPAETQQLLDDLDQFIDDVIKPIESEDDNIRFFDHRREDSRTDWDRDGLPNAEWEALLGRMRTRPTRPGSCATTCPSGSAARTAPTSTWRSCENTWPAGPRPAQRPPETRARSWATS